MAFDHNGATIFDQNGATDLAASVSGCEAGVSASNGGGLVVSPIAGTEVSVGLQGGVQGDKLPDAVHDASADGSDLFGLEDVVIGIACRVWHLLPIPLPSPFLPWFSGSRAFFFP